MADRLEGLVFLKKHKKHRISLSKKYVANLNWGILRLYKNVPNIQGVNRCSLDHEFKIDLSEVIVVCDDFQKKFTLKFKMESYQLVPENREDYGMWKESIHRHRLFRQDQIRQGMRANFSVSDFENELENPKKAGSADDKTDIASDALARSMEEIRNAHRSTTAALQEVKKLTKISRMMFDEIKCIWKRISKIQKVAENNDFTVVNKARSTTRIEEFSEDDSDGIQGNSPEKSCKSSEEGKTSEKKHEIIEARFPIITKSNLSGFDNILEHQKIGDMIGRKLSDLTTSDQISLDGNSTSKNQKPEENLDFPITTKSNEIILDGISPLKNQKTEENTPILDSIPKLKEIKPVGVVREEPSHCEIQKPPRIHREVLPAPQMPGEPIGFSAIAAAAVTKTLPISTYEPLGLLQVLCEELRFVPQTINKALSSSDPLDRMCYIAAFAISGYFAMIGRNRKPFNPILGETFEYISEDGWKYHAEQIKHHPSISAVAASGRNFEWWQTATGSPRTTWTGSLQVQPELPVRLRLNFGEDNSEEYSWNKVKTIVENASGAPESRVIRNEGSMIIRSSSGIFAKITFKSENSIFGEIKNPKNGISCNLTGRWNGILKIQKNQKKLFEISPNNETYEKYYGFSKFTMTLNEILENTVIPVTDSRFRPDQRWLENGNPQKARETKLLLENEHRIRLKNGKSGKPLWFELKNDDFSKKNLWIPNGKYWIEKEKGFRGEYSSSIPNIFN